MNDALRPVIGSKERIARLAMWQGSIVTVIGIVAAVYRPESAGSIVGMVTSISITLGVGTTMVSGANAYITARTAGAEEETTTTTSRKKGNASTPTSDPVPVTVIPSTDPLPVSVVPTEL